MPAPVVDHADSRYLVRSSYTSSYSHMGEIYLYHDLYGYILKMSPDILEFLDEFASAKLPAEVCKGYANAFGDQTPEAFVGIFLQFGCLVTPGHDELTDIWNKIPVKGRWNVWQRHKDGSLTIYAAWGDWPIAKHTLTSEEREIWDAFDSETRLDQLAEDHNPDTIAQLIKKLGHNSVQAVKLSAVGDSFYKGRQHMRPPYLSSTMPYAPFDPETDPVPVPVEDMFSPEGYYRAEVDHAEEQFDHQETTLSHLFRRSHAALKGRSYGQALIEALQAKGWAGGDTVKVLEIGGGLGWVAKAVTETLQAQGKTVSYDIMELSPTLAASQRERTEGLPVTVHMGDVLSDDLPGSGYDLVISNEMVGDLTAIKLTHERLGMGGPDGIDDEKFEAALDTIGVAGELVKRHVVPIGDALDPFYLNIGAWQMVERLWDVMAPGGGAVITEFGEMARYPILSTQLDHPELSIHFGHLMLVARSVGFEADFDFVMDLLDMARDLQGLSTTRSYFRALKALLADHDIELEKIGYTKGMFKGLVGDKLRLKNIGELEFDRIEDRLMGLVPHEFKALMLTKPS